MKLHLATHHGMCFGVRDALRATYEAAALEPVTMLGQLAHNPVLNARLRTMGVRDGTLENTTSSGTSRVIITAHGASDDQREGWRKAGHAITDTTCPLVRKAHQALAALVQAGCHPVVIGQKNHVEVRGLVGDFPHATVLLDPDEIVSMPPHARFGVISQTTQPQDRVLALVEEIKRQRPASEVRFVDTVCHPTRQRQDALEQLCRTCGLIIVIGGRNSNNTRQLVEKAERLGVRAHQIESADDLCPEWVAGVSDVGVTAGTSTLDETVATVMSRLAAMNPCETKTLETP